MNILVGTLGTLQAFLEVEAMGFQRVLVEAPNGSKTQAMEASYRVIGLTLQDGMLRSEKTERPARHVLSPNDASGMVQLSINGRTINMETKTTTTTTRTLPLAIEPGESVSVGLSWSRDRKRR